MENRDLIDLIGEETYLSACRQLANDVSASVDFGHDIPYYLEQLKYSPDEIWNTWKTLVLEIPSYSIWMYVNLHYVNHCSDEQQVQLLAIMSSILETGTRVQIEACKYALWVDFFEDQSTVSKCWTYLQQSLTDDTAKEHLLEVSGPVPYTLKQSYYESCLGNHRLRSALVIALTRSCTDVYGQIDRSHALNLFNQIEKEDPELPMTDLKALLKNGT